MSDSTPTDGDGYLWRSTAEPVPGEPADVPGPLRIARAHQFREGSSGDGWTAPREHWSECSCGVILTTWQQLYAESDEVPTVAYAAHIAHVIATEGEPEPARLTTDADVTEQAPLDVVAEADPLRTRGATFTAAPYGYLQTRFRVALSGRIMRQDWRPTTLTPAAFDGVPLRNVRIGGDL